MNKKFIVGLSSLALGGIFFACGDGSIYEMSDNDDAIKYAYVDMGDSSMMTNAIADCQADPECAAKMETTVTVSSSSVAASSSSVTSTGTETTSSSSYLSSSSSLLPITSSSSVLTITTESSSSVEGGSTVIPSGDSDLGTCAPTTSPISKGESTTWKFSLNADNSLGWKATNLIQASFEWTFGTGGTPSISTDASTLTSDTVTYTTSGTAQTAVTITSSDGLVSETVQCTDLQVNGAAITGCSCTAAATEVDVASSGTASWTVSGCTTDGTITGYSWTDATGSGETATATLTTKGEVVTPVVTVSNDDNTKQEFTCESVKAIDSSSPDYEITTTNVAITLPAGDVIVSLGGDVPSSPSSCTFSCNANGSFTGTVAGVEISGGHWASVSIPASSCANGQSISVSLSMEATCSINAW